MSVRPSVRPSVGWSVRNAFVKIAENGVMQDEDASYVVYTALLDVSSHLYKIAWGSLSLFSVFHSGVSV